MNMNTVGNVIYGALELFYLFCKSCENVLFKVFCCGNTESVIILLSYNASSITYFSLNFCL